MKSDTALDTALKVSKIGVYAATALDLADRCQLITCEQYDCPLPA